MNVMTTYLGPEETVQEGCGEASFHFCDPRYGKMSVTYSENGDDKSKADRKRNREK